jgi:lysophospholipid acyltransferase (LPLAT)-like uncharacterized protein
MGLKAWLKVRFGTFVIGFVGRTLFPVEHGAEFTRRRLLEEDGNVIFAIWHNRLFYMVYYLASRYRWRGKRISIIISASRDGRFISDVISAFGGDIVQGSSSRKGTGALLGLCRRAEAGNSVIVTPDGPRGPRYKAHPGVILLAQKTGLPLVPICYGASRKLVFNSWDRFIFPMPFCRAKVIYGKPLYVPPDADAAARERLRLDLEREMLEAVRAADL